MSVSALTTRNGSAERHGRFTRRWGRPVLRRQQSGFEAGRPTNPRTHHRRFDALAVYPDEFRRADHHVYVGDPALKPGLAAVAVLCIPVGGSANFRPLKLQSAIQSSNRHRCRLSFSMAGRGDLTCIGLGVTTDLADTFCHPNGGSEMRRSLPRFCADSGSRSGRPFYSPQARCRCAAGEYMRPWSAWCGVCWASSSTCSCAVAVGVERLR